MEAPFDGLLIVFISVVCTQLSPRTPNNFPLPRHWTRDRDFGPATATLDPRPRLWTRDPRLWTRDPRPATISQTRTRLLRFVPSTDWYTPSYKVLDHANQFSINNLYDPKLLLLAHKWFYETAYETIQYFFIFFCPNEVRHTNQKVKRAFLQTVFKVFS